MIYQLLATLLLSASVCSAPVPHNAVYYDSEYRIILDNSSECNDYVYINLLNYLSSLVDNDNFDSPFDSLYVSSFDIPDYAIPEADYIDELLFSLDDNEFEPLRLYFAHYIEISNISYTYGLAFNRDLPYFTFSYVVENTLTYELLYEGFSSISKIIINCYANYYSDFKQAIELDIEANSGDDPEPEPQPSNLYQIIYDFFYGIFNNETLSSMTWTIGGQSVDLNAWICHSLTIILLITLLIILLLITRWAFRVFAGLIK